MYRVSVPCVPAPPDVFERENSTVPVKRHRGEPGHTHGTHHTRAHTSTRITQKEEPHNHPTIQTHQHTCMTAVPVCMFGSPRCLFTGMYVNNYQVSPSFTYMYHVHVRLTHVPTLWLVGAVVRTLEHDPSTFSITPFTPFTVRSNEDLWESRLSAYIPVGWFG